jgi:hypothetical protein
VTIDLIVIGLIALPVYLSALWFNVLDRLFELTSQHKNHEFDWIIVLVVVLGLTAKIFSIRRVIDLRRADLELEPRPRPARHGRGN